jgi:hypothetical protein
MDPIPFQDKIDQLNDPNFTIANDYKDNLKNEFEHGVDKICRSEKIRQALKVASIACCLVGAAALSLYAIDVIDTSTFNMLYIAIPVALAFVAFGALHRIYAHTRHEDLKTEYKKFFNACVREIVSQVNLNAKNGQARRFRALIERVSPYVSELTFQHDRIHAEVPHDQIPELIKMFKKALKVTMDRVPLTPEIVRAIAHVGVAELEVIGAKALPPRPWPGGFDQNSYEFRHRTFEDMGLIHLNYEFIVNLTTLRLTRIELENRAHEGADGVFEPKNDILLLLQYRKIETHLKELFFLEMNEPNNDDAFFEKLHECWDLETLGVNEISPLRQPDFLRSLKGSRVSELWIPSLEPETLTALLDDFTKKVKEQEFGTVKTIHFTKEFGSDHLNAIANHKNRFSTIEIPDDFVCRTQEEQDNFQKFQQLYEPDETGGFDQDKNTILKGKYKQKEKGLLSHVPKFK